MLTAQTIKTLERSEPGTAVDYLKQAVDEDKDEIFYSIVGGDNYDTFSIHEKLGFISVKASTDALSILPYH